MCTTSLRRSSSTEDSTACSGARERLVKTEMRLEAMSLPPTEATPATRRAARETTVETTFLEIPMPET